MEVHAHSHTARKKWTHYFWEFIMLFLAVFCGFLAENIREHTIEHKREKEYIQSLIRDLQADTAELKSCVEGNTRKTANYDSLCSLLKRPDPFQNTDKLYYYFLPTTYYYPFRAIQGTIRQLENAGGLRLIRNKQASDSITFYYELVRSAEGQMNTFLRYFDQYHELAFRVFDYSQIDSVFYARENILTTDHPYSLLSTDKATIKTLFNKLFALRFILESYISYLKRLHEKGVHTLEFLKKEYHLN